MAFQKSVTIPGTPYVANYFAIGDICHIRERARSAKFTIDLYPDASHLSQPVRSEAATVTFSGPAFDLYFTKAVIGASTVNAYAAIYQALTDLTAALKAKAALAVTPQPTPPPPSLTANQLTLVTYATIASDPAFGGELVFDGGVMV